VVIPFYAGLEYLDRTLAGLSCQTLSPNLWEIVISEDGGTQQTDGLIDKYPVLNIRRIRIDRHGYRLATVRNVAIQASRAPIIILLDFDCVPSSSHLERHLSVLQRSSKIASVGLRRFVDLGSIQAAEILQGRCWNTISDVPSISSGGLSSDKRTDVLHRIDIHPFPSNLFHGCNVGFWRSTAEKVGLFSEDFNGGHGYEDLEFGWRLQKAGVRFSYVDSTVFHQENSIVGIEQRDKGRERNYSVLARLAPELVEFRERC
jgi:GT2 family glycosyltransferase